jgi:starch-binding outer membrane protein, SusD/RagB family
MQTLLKTTMQNRPFPSRSRLVATSVLVLATGLAACHGSVTDALLYTTIPTVINPSSVQSAAGADAVRLGALGRLRTATGGGESSWLFGGLLGDEWTTSSTFIQNDEADERAITITNSTTTSEFAALARVRTDANQGIALMKQYQPTAIANTGELYFARGFAELQMALDYCNGIPLSDGSGATPVFGQPLTNQAVFTIASASFDSAKALETGTDAFSISILNASKIGKARAQQALNNYAAAAAEVAGIPTAYEYDNTYEQTVGGPSGDNILWSQPLSQRRYSLGDTIATVNGTVYKVKPSIPFASAKDPRLPGVGNIPAKTLSQDGSVLSITTTLWGSGTPVPVVSGIDARLIEAENFLATGDITNWLLTLNTLRTSGALKLGTITVPVMPVLFDPGTAAARVDMLFYEKAFWTFSRGERLGDMRRLIRQYGRDPATVFPGAGGNHYRGVAYGPDVNLPVPYNEGLGNPNFTGCLDRKA